MKRKLKLLRVSEGDNPLASIMTFTDLDHFKRWIRGGYEFHEKLTEYETDVLGWDGTDWLEDNYGHKWQRLSKIDNIIVKDYASDPKAEMKT